MNFSRREFLKLLSLLSLSMAGSNASKSIRLAASSQRPNILMVVFDALSARHVSLYGYQRETTPNLKRFAERSMVFHRHYSAGNYTMPGTTSLLTGVYPWTHRVFHFHGLPLQTYREQNIFTLLASKFNSAKVYSQNHLLTYILHSMAGGMSLEDLGRVHDAVLYSENKWSGNLFKNDYLIEQRIEDHLYRVKGSPISPLFSEIIPLIYETQTKEIRERYKEEYPDGLPHLTPYVFSFRETTDWVIEQCSDLAAPFFGYFHLIPPHDPYKASAEFIGAFDDDFSPVQKPPHVLGDFWPQEILDKFRKEYDEYILNMDAEFGRMIDTLEGQGVLDNTILVFTSDHGELFERGLWHHNTPLMYEPVIHIPLLIRMPGQTERQDITTPNSNIDILPTLMHLNGLEIPNWIEGKVLPPWKPANPERAVFSVEAKQNYAQKPLTKFTLAMLTQRYKLIYSRGYEDYDEIFELYDLEADPEELNDLSGQKPAVTEQMKEEMLARLAEGDKPW